MKALYIHGKLDLRIDECPTPEPLSSQVRIRPAYIGVCGSDLHYYYEGANGAFVVKEPLMPGHELSGTVDFDPSGEFAPGTPVTVHPATFGQCLPGLEDKPNLWPGGAYLGSASTWPHTQGATAEYVVLERSMLRRLPEGLSLEAAALAEPLAVGLHAIRLAGGVAGKSVLVSGAGPIGLLALAAARLSGAAEVAASDVLAGPLSRAKALGAHDVYTVPADEVPSERYDIVLECSANPRALGTALNAVRRAGTVVQVGMFGAAPVAIAIAPLVAKEVRLVGTFRFTDEIDDAVAMLAAHPELAQIITHVFDMADSEAAFTAAKDSELSGKVLISVASGAVHG